MPVRGLVATLLLAAASGAGAPGPLRPLYDAVLYEPGSARTEVLFRVHAWQSADGEQLRIEYRDREGALVTTEEVRLRDGELERYEIDHPEAGRRGTIERRGDRMAFHFTREDESETGEETPTDPFLAPASVVPYVQYHWAALAAGERRRVRLGLPRLGRSLGFELSRSEATGAEGEDRVTIELRPSSFLLRLVLDPIVFHLTPDGRRLLGTSGRVPALRRTPDGWERTAAEGIYRRLE